MENNKTKLNASKALSIFLIIIIVALLAYILIDPVSNFINKKYKAEEILQDDVQKLKDKVAIEQYKLKDKELVFLTNNSDKTLYDINVLGFFFDSENKPLYTNSSNYLYFLPAGETIAVELYCYDESAKFQDFDNVTIDFNYSTESDITSKYFYPMNDKVELENFEVKNDNQMLVVTGNIKNTSGHKIANTDIITVFYKDGIPTASTSGEAKNILENSSRAAISTPIPSIDYDEFEVFVKSSYRYSYN